MIRIILTFAVVAVLAAPASAQKGSGAPSGADPAQSGQVLRVFLDCAQCDFNNIRQDITFINYVRDQSDADVHVLVTTQGTASGGREYTFEFIGLGPFADIQQRLIYTSSGSDTDDERRLGVSRTFSLGLTPYLLRTPTADQLSLRYTAPSGAAPAAQAVDDPWNFWIFRVGSSIQLDGEQREKSRRVRINASANRTTERWKFSINSNADFNDREFTLSDGSILDSTTKTWNVTGSVIKSLGDEHWGGLLRGEARSSTQSNERVDARVSTGIEYDFYTYAESTRRSFVVQYSVGLQRVKYYEVTLFGKLDETLTDHRLAAILALRQPWGTWRMSGAYSAYLNDVSKYNVDFFADADIRLFRGFSLNVQGSASRVRNQLYLPAGEATDEEVLLRLRRLQTGYRYRMQVGFSYQFGSIYNNVVNPRWSSNTGGGPGGGGGGGG